VRSEASPVMFCSSIAYRISSRGIWFARLNLSFSGSGTGSSSSDSTIGSEADVSLDFAVSLLVVSAIGFTIIVYLISLLSRRELSPTSHFLFFRLLSATASSL
jgi:hypothetical protein